MVESTKIFKFMNATTKNEKSSNMSECAQNEFVQKNILVKYILHHCVELCQFVSTASLSGKLKWKSARQTWKDTLYFVHIFCIHSGSLPNW